MLSVIYINLVLIAVYNFSNINFHSWYFLTKIKNMDTLYNIPSHCI